MIVSGLLAVFALFPGLPFLPFMLASIGFGVTAYFLRKQQQAVEAQADTPEETPETQANQIGDSIHSDEIHLEVAPDLVNTVLQGDSGIEARIDKIRRYIAEEYGFVLPSIRMTDNPTMERNTYRLNIQGCLSIVVCCGQAQSWP